MVSFDEFVAAYRVFGKDESFSGGSECHVFAPWEEPKLWVDGLTQLPESITEEELWQQLSEIDTIAISCTDKDMVHQTWEMESMGGTRNVWLLAIAGAVIQPDGERYTAMQCVATYLAEQAQAGKIPKLGRVIALSHNEVCGAVRQWNNNERLVDLVKRAVGKNAQLRDFEENTLMTALSRHGAKMWGQFKDLTNVCFDLGLFDMQRDGCGKKSRIRPLTTDGFILSVEDLKDDDKIKKILR